MYLYWQLLYSNSIPIYLKRVISLLLGLLLQLTLVRYVHAETLGSWTIARYFYLYFAYSIASSNHSKGYIS